METTFKTGDKVIYNGRTMEITDIHGESADLEYQNALCMTVNAMGIKLSKLKKA